MPAALVAQRQLAGVGRSAPLTFCQQVARRRCREEVAILGAALAARLPRRRQEATQAFGRVVAVPADVLGLAGSSFLDFGKDVVNGRLEA
jgi:hypothetical protein